MDLTSAIIGLCAIACFVVPVVYIQYAQKKKKKEFLANFLNLAGRQHINITQHEQWNQYYAIGLDGGTNKLFYLKKKDGQEQTALIDLNEVETCSVVNKQRKVHEDIIIERLDLAFKYRNPKAGEKVLEFYDKEVSMALNEELKLVEKWKNIINARTVSFKKAA